MRKNNKNISSLLLTFAIGVIIFLLLSLLQIYLFRKPTISDNVYRNIDVVYAPKQLLQIVLPNENN